jgi:succinyl-CoA synthetase alpha subunit
MTVQGEIRTGLYFDSVTLMIVGRDLLALEDVADAAAVMATRENKAILRSAGLWIDPFETAGDTDLILAVEAETAEAAAAALEAAASRLQQARMHREAGEQQLPASVESAVRALPGANLALISIAGRYAAEQARQALDAGLHVMLFSDNVSLVSEIALKNLARQRGLLMMGPDCGTAILNGVPLAFANAVNRGDIGIVAAAGTGLQEVSTILSNEGAGVSQAIGTGGRDVKREVGGIMFLEALEALRDDPETRVIVLISKPPDETVLRRIGEAAAAIGKPVIAAFLGADEALLRQFGITPAATLEEAALVAAALSKCHHPEAARKFLETRQREIRDAAAREAARFSGPQKYIRGLFSGGTFCAEAQLIFRRHALGDVYSNVPLAPFAPLADVWKSQAHTLIDLGDDAFTVGRPHPMIDYSLRNRRILEEAADPQTAVILLDVVLGYGANPDPAGELVPVIAAAPKRVAFVCSITGTPQDPQDSRRVESALAAAGVRVFPSNAAAAEFAAQIAVALGGR